MTAGLIEVKPSKLATYTRISTHSSPCEPITGWGMCQVCILAYYTQSVIIIKCASETSKAEKMIKY